MYIKLDETDIRLAIQDYIKAKTGLDLDCGLCNPDHGIYSEVFIRIKGGKEVYLEPYKTSMTAEIYFEA